MSEALSQDPAFWPPEDILQLVLACQAAHRPDGQVCFAPGGQARLEEAVVFYSDRSTRLKPIVRTSMEVDLAHFAQALLHGVLASHVEDTIIHFIDFAMKPHGRQRNKKFAAVKFHQTLIGGNANHLSTYLRKSWTT